MAKYAVRLGALEKRLPAAYKLPRSFNTFTEVCRAADYGEYGFFDVKFVNPNALVGLKVDAQIVPFLSLGDGGVVAFWFRTPRTPCVVWFDSEGQYGIAGATWADFLVRFQKGKTSVADIDECRERAPALPGTRNKRITPRTEIKKIYRALDAWLDQIGDGETRAGTEEQDGDDQMEDLTIHPLLGVGPVSFGMTRTQVKSRVGAPDSSEADEIMDCLYEWRGKVKYEYGPRRLVSIDFPAGTRVFFDGVDLNGGPKAIADLKKKDRKARTKRGWTNCPSLGICLGGRGKERCVIVYGKDKIDFYDGFLEV